MIEKKKNVLMPFYYKEFQCIGGSCEDNCCIGWDVEIDKKTYQKYQNVKEKELLQFFHNYIYQNPAPYDHNVDYAIVELVKNNRCPFLNEQNLCMIQVKLNHDHLSNVCATYPRYANEINGVVECSANISCPEAARLILMKKEGIAFSLEENTASSRMIINTVVNTKEHNGNILVKYFVEIREFTISLLQNRNYSLWERLLILGHFFQELQESVHSRGEGRIQKMIESFPGIMDEVLKKAKSSENATKALQFRIIKEITDKVNQLTEIDSQRYIQFTNEFSKGLGIASQSGSDRIEKAYHLAAYQYYKPFMKKHEYLIENYLVNYVFGGLFPASESTKPFEAYMMLVIRYALIQYNLIGISAFRGGLTEEDSVKFIQAFSKAIEHHHTYLEGIAALMKKRGYFNLNHAEILLKNE